MDFLQIDYRIIVLAKNLITNIANIKAKKKLRKIGNESLPIIVEKSINNKEKQKKSAVAVLIVWYCLFFSINSSTKFTSSCVFLTFF